MATSLQNFLINKSLALPILITTLLAIIVTRFWRRSRLPKGTRLPPGPPGVPFLGNLPQIPAVHAWIKFKQWSDQYGPIFRLNLAGGNHYVVSTEKIANDLLRGRGMIYSSREQLPSAAVLLSDNKRMLFLPHGELWRKQRKMMHHFAMPSAAASYQPSQLAESSRLLRNMIREPAKYEKWLELYAAGLVFRLAYGKVIESDDAELKAIQSVVHTVERIASPGQYLVDTFPILMKLPNFLAPFKRELKQLHKVELDMYRGLLNRSRGKKGSGEAPDCWQRTFIESEDKFDLSDDEGAYVIGALYEAGSSTTSSAMMNVLLALVHYPEWQKKLEEETDRVVGNSRMPIFEDLESLPTVRAVVKESLRWRPITAGGVPHLLDEDDVYEGFFFPKGTNIHPCQWAIHREEALYPDPETFNPDRWLSPSFPTFREPLSVYPNLQGFSSFGHGRRICPGLNIAERSLYIFTARLAWACHISQKKGPDGKEIEVPWYDYNTGFVCQPNWFPFDLEARDGKNKIVEREWKKDWEV
ncbi:cytochrome P450 [Clohesyomyces aquaticus]|uniref:Cytochrome P450 n=1 Tax=Clohesyomyces aquaticus TaxID=1231657 RepID=A0A1Y1ZFE6_9PLEO|nr:cytochrome P450 [Clohesyomyces aquaticus]